MSEPFDLRGDFFRSAFERGLPYREYISTASDAHRPRWDTMNERITVPDDMAPVLVRFERTMNILVLSGTWCGDCIRQCPMLAKIEAAAPALRFRFLDNNENPEIRDELRIAGGARVPAVVVLSEDFFEVGRFGDRTLSAYRRKAALELGPACEAGIVPPTDDELRTEVREWIEYFERLQLMLRLSPFLRKRHGD